MAQKLTNHLEAALISLLKSGRYYYRVVPLDMTEEMQNLRELFRQLEKMDLAKIFTSRKKGREYWALSSEGRRVAKLLSLLKIPKKPGKHGVSDAPVIPSSACSRFCPPSVRCSCSAFVAAPRWNSNSSPCDIR